MNQFRPIVAVYIAAFISTLVLNGCGDKPKASAVVEPLKLIPAETVVDSVNKPPVIKHLSKFLSLHTQFCEKNYKSSESLKKDLDSAKELSLAKNFEGVYEILVGDISFAVSPEEDGCTTDVMIQKNGIQIFTFEEMNNALINHGYKEAGKSVSRMDRGTDQSELTVLEKKYISPKGEITTLDFPLEKKDKYYMTLFTEKFKEARREIKEKALLTLKMASN